MIVDDVDWVRGMLEELFNEVDGVTVCGTASDGDEAIDAILARDASPRRIDLG